MVLTFSKPSKKLVKFGKPSYYFILKSALGSLIPDGPIKNMCACTHGVLLNTLMKFPMNILINI